MDKFNLVNGGNGTAQNKTIPVGRKGRVSGCILSQPNDILTFFVNSVLIWEEQSNKKINIQLVKKKVTLFVIKGCEVLCVCGILLIKKKGTNKRKRDIRILIRKKRVVKSQKSY